MAKAVRVRIAVAVGKDGLWAAHGWKLSERSYPDSVEESAVRHYRQYVAGDDRAPHIVWVEADVPLPPESQTIPGQVAGTTEGQP